MWFNLGIIGWAIDVRGRYFIDVGVDGIRRTIMLMIMIVIIIITIVIIIITIAIIIAISRSLSGVSIPNTISLLLPTIILSKLRGSFTDFIIDVGMIIEVKFVIFHHVVYTTVCRFCTLMIYFSNWLSCSSNLGLGKNILVSHYSPQLGIGRSVDPYLNSVSSIFYLRIGVIPPLKISNSSVLPLYLL